MTEALDQLHEDGRQLVEGILKRKQEDEAWKEWRRANPPLAGRPARVEWP